MLDTLLAAVARAGRTTARWSRRCARRLTDAALDPAFIAEAVLLPSEAFIGDQMARRRSRARSTSRARRCAPSSAARSSRCGAPPMPRTAANRYEYNRRRPRARGGCGRSRSAISWRPGRRDAPALAQRQYRRGRQHDRPPGRARRARQLRRARARRRARRLLRALSGQCAGARQMVHACRRSRPATTRSSAVEALAAASRFHPRQPQPAALAGRRLLGQPARLPRRARAAATASSPT